ncbi:hypothetical protein OHB31_01540 [Streptomyces microflavus]|uniref:hypothetical protein n=1 Tax=Streptomyces TaxID=1883 RepID=UPI000C05448B|nr:MULTISPECIES: hypothetical protein [Streptomyces]WSA58919.1 hypothetical protein OHB31_01540 [Streptomyces microflavus]
MTHPYEQDLGALYLTRAPAHLDDDDAALALIAHCPDISAARIKYGLACRHFAATGDESRIDAYFTAISALVSVYDGSLSRSQAETMFLTNC